MEVDVQLGDALRFLDYDKGLNRFKVQGDLLKTKDIGDYPIQVTAKFFNATFIETIRKTFILTIWDDTAP